MRVLVTGAGGLVGRATVEHCVNLGDDVLSYDHKSLDITDNNLVRETIVRNSPDVVINCAAWTDVDACEFDIQRAYAVNAGGPENLAAASREVNAAFVTISTDYVFDGTKEGFYTQEDKPNPQSVYGQTKLEGEQRAAFAYRGSIVVRSGYIFGQGGTNFLSTVTERAKNGETLKAINDTYGTPTYAKDLAGRLRQLAQLNVPGIYHVVNSGMGVSFEQFTSKAVELVGNGRAVVETISSAELNRPANRPHNSRLRCLLSERIGLPSLRSWETALEEYVKSQG